MIDDAFEELKKFISELDQYIRNHYSEADTRVKFIDPILTRLLGWNEHLHIRREENYTSSEERRCIDYVVSLQEPILVVEAKKNLKHFEVPTTTSQVAYSLSGVMKSWKNAWAAVSQAQKYCVDAGARYALVTNGHQYIAFKAVSERASWLKGQALVLRDPTVLKDRFTLFYECLAKETIAQDKLSDFAFPSETPPRKEKPRARIRVPNSGYRNQLFPVLDGAFREILLDVPQSDPRFLRECYCSSADAMRYSGQLDAAVADPLPLFRTPVEEVRPGHRADAFDRTMREGKVGPRGVPLFVLMGGLGVGKTTFLHWYFEEQMPKQAKTQNVVVFCDYRMIECNPEELHHRTLKLAIDGISSLTEKHTTGFNQLREMFRSRIERELRGSLKPLVADRDARDRRIGELLEKYQDYSPEHIGAIVNYLKGKMGKQVVLVLDNMDQKAPALQDKLYQVAHEFVYGCHFVVVVSLREATWRRMTRSPSFNAFASREFHVKAQSVDLVLEKRLNFLTNRLSHEKVELTTPDGKALDIADLDRFIQLIRRSLLSEGADPRILQCVDAVSNGNIREQLEMIYAFLVSGQTKADDYFWSYAKNEQMRIPFHEVLHSMLYADCKFFDEGAGHRFMNVFEPAPKTNSSHFTALRILAFLHQGLGQTGELRAADFVTPEDISSEFEDYGWSKEEVSFQVNRMSYFGLLLPESGEVGDTLIGQACALSKCGLYYLTSLYADFTYFAAMACDTSIADQALVHEIAVLILKNIAGPKVPLDIRTKIAERFVGYLDSREQTELKGAITKHPVVGRIRFTPAMIQAARSLPKQVQ